MNTNKSIAQTIHAVYKSYKSVVIQTEDGFSPNIAPLEFTCHFYRKGNRYISFNKPDYLKKYPEGRITYSNPNVGANFYGVYSLNMDTIININYKALDSSIWRYTNYTNVSNEQKPYSFNFEPGFQQWEILNETKAIGGLSCQRARLKYPDGQLGWDLWFCPDIQVECGVSNIFGLPGLVVEANDLGASTRYELQYYNVEETFSDEVFWPVLFNKPFVHRGTIKNRNKGSN